MHVELQATCAALGYHEGNVYHKEPDCLETVKDLIRFLKHEDDTCEIRRQLGNAQIVQNDLVPLVKHYSDDSTLLDVVIRLLVNLTQPGVLCFQNHIPEDKTNRNYFLEIESHLQAYKEAFVDEGFFAIITKKLGNLLKLDWEHRHEEDRLLIERILVLIRNILHVPPNPGKEKRTDDDASIHDQVLWSLHISGMEDLLLYLASSEDETQFCLHVLEIISLMFREQTAEQLSTSGVARSLSEKEQDERELELMRERERAQKRANMLKYSARHSCFGGTYTINNMKSISDRDVIFHRRLGNIEDVTFDHNKPKKKRPKNRTPITEVELTRRSTLSIRAFLREFCVQLLENCYNPLMYYVKDVLVRSKAQENDETYYLWATRFFMEFNRRYNFRIDLVSETMSVQSFHNIHMNLQTFHEMILTNKKEAVIWSRRLHLALDAYHELLQTMLAMEKTNDPQLRDSVNVMKSNVFYMLEYRDIFLMLLKDFDETKQSRTYLKDLVEATHLFVKMLESYSKSRGHLVVQRKKHHGGHRKKKQKSSAHSNGVTEPSEEELEELWDNISSELSAIFQGRGEIPQEVTPFDAASEIDVDLQRVNAMRRIQEGLRANQPGEAVALFRAAREVWPEREEFGSADISPEDEFMALREICFANIPRPENEEPENVPELPEESDVEDELEEAGVKVSEEEFNFSSFILRFVTPRVVQAYVTLLAQYKTNSAHTNHCVLKMLHRIGFECEMIGMLFQARLFRVFQSIYADPACTTRHFKELMRFSQHVVARFIEVAQKNSKVFMELFFWKTVRDVRDITEGYGYTEHQSKKVKQLWTEEEDMEIQRLVEQFRDEETPDGDMADFVLANLIDQSKTRRQVVRQLVHLDLLGSAKDLKRRNGPVRSREWETEEEEDLTQLLKEFKDNDYPLMDILANLRVKRSRPKVIEKLLELGLIQDKKEVMKKRKSKKGKKGKQGYEEEPEGFEEEHGPPSDDEDRMDDEPETAVTSSDESIGDQSDVDDDEPIYITKIRKTAKQAINSGLRAAVQWISDTLSRTADEREEDGDEEPIPVVPVTEETEEAMENATFHTLLKRLGMKSPASEQEMFWRIAGKLSPNDLRSRVEALKTCLSTDNTKSRKAGGHLEALRALAKQKQADGGKRKRRHRGQRESTGSEDHVTAEADQTEPVGTSSNQSSPAGRQAGRSRFKRLLPDFSEDESDNERLVIDTDAPAEAALQPSKRVKIVDSDDSSDADNEAGDTGKTQPQPVKRVKIVDSDDSSDADNEAGDTGKTQPQPVKRVKIVDSDDSSDADNEAGDTGKTQPQPVKRVKIVDSDDSSDADNEAGDTGKTQPQPVKRVKIVDSDDNSDTDNEAGDTGKTQPQPVKRVKIVDSDDSGAESTHDNDTNDIGATLPQTELGSFPATMLSQTPDESDSDLDDHIPLRKVTKKCTIESDSDDD